MLRVVGARAPGGAALELTIVNGLLAETAPAQGRTLEAGGGFVVPAVVDSHVHLSFRGADRRLVEAGVGAAVDLAAPLDRLLTIDGLEVVHTGPMLAAPGGYPTQSWGRGGYGAECATVDDVMVVVEAAAAAGARVVKLSLGHPPELTPAQLSRAVEEAHQRDMKVAVHALSDDAAARGAALGADLLAHTPVEPLSPSTVQAWSGRAVVSTLAAFGASPSAIDNLRRLAAAGALVLYGTDLGNSRPMGIQGDEVDALVAAGLSAQAIVEAMTSAPSAYWGLDTGQLMAGRPARLLLLDADPLMDPGALSRPRRIVLGSEVIDAIAPSR